MSGVSDEVEAKLLARDAATLAEIRRLTSIAGFACREVSHQHLRTTYFDDADRSLSRHGVALRLRRQADDWEMTLKWSGRIEGDVHRRPELNLPLAAAPATPLELPAAVAEVVDPLLQSRPVEALVTTDIERTTIELSAGEGVIALLVLDRVRHSAPTMAPQEPYCEVEIELADGSLEDLQRIAASLKATHRLQPTTESKFSRALADLDRPSRRS